MGQLGSGIQGIDKNEIRFHYPIDPYGTGENPDRGFCPFR